MRGDPEIEVHSRGTQPDQYFATGVGFNYSANPPQWPSDRNNPNIPLTPLLEPTMVRGVGYLNAPKLSGFICAANSGKLNSGWKRFDFNGEHGATYRQNVLGATPNDFGYHERVHGTRNAILKSRLVRMEPLFEVSIWERDDNGACPTGVSLDVPAMFAVGVSVRYPTNGYSDIKPAGSVNDWRWFFGLNNGSDLMGRWRFESWGALEAPADPSFSRSGSHVDVTLLNRGVNRNNVPASQDPYPTYRGLPVRYYVLTGLTAAGPVCRRRRGRAMAAVSLTLGAARLHGQAVVAPRFEIEPTLGVYVPLARQFEGPAVLASGAPSGATVARVTSRQRPGPVFGLTARWRATPRFGASLWFAQANSDVENRGTLAGGGTVAGQAAARVLVGGLLVEATQGTRSARLTWNAGAGPVQVYRGGTPYRGVEGVRDFGAALQLGGRYTLGRHAGVRLTARDLLYRTSFGAGADATPSRFQNDLSMSLGLAINP